MMNCTLKIKLQGPLLYLLVTAVCAIPTFAPAHAQQGMEAWFIKTDVPEWNDVDQAMNSVTTGIHIPPETVARFITRHSSLKGARDSFSNKSYPVFNDARTYVTDYGAYRKDHFAYLADLKSYTDDSNNYKAAGGGTTVSKERLPALQAWYQRLEAWRGRLLSWKARADKEAVRLNGEARRIQSNLDDAASQWLSSCRSFTRDGKEAVKSGVLADFDDKISKVEYKAKLERNALEVYKTQLPGYVEDVEEMAKKADEAREEGADKALEQGLTVITQHLLASFDKQEKVTREQLRKVKQILYRDRVGKDVIKTVLKNWVDDGVSVLTIKTKRELIEQLSTLKDVSGAFGQVNKKQMLEALSSCLSTFVHCPLLNLVVVNTEVYTGLLYTGTSYFTAKARVGEMMKMTETALKDIERWTKLYKGHVKELKNLKVEREKVASQPA